MASEARNNIQKAGVQYIIDSVVEELEADAERKYVTNAPNYCIQYAIFTYTTFRQIHSQEQNAK